MQKKVFIFLGTITLCNHLHAMENDAHHEMTETRIQIVNDAKTVTQVDEEIYNSKQIVEQLKILNKHMAQLENNSQSLKNIGSSSIVKAIQDYQNSAAMKWIFSVMVIVPAAIVIVVHYW